MFNITFFRCRNHIISLFFFLGLFCTAPSLCWAQPSPNNDAPLLPSPASVRRALFIGISQYRALPHLPGSLNDIAIIQQVLTKRFGFSPKHMRSLTNETATRAGILQALRQLVQEAGPQDVAYIHYSGHGSQIRDFNGDEQDDHLDETLVPFDGRTEGIPDITDDELDEIFSHFRTSQVVIAFDSCHSGTATRGVEFRTRSVPRDLRLSLYSDIPINRKRGGSPMADRHVLLTGAAANERALDGPINGKYFGLFSYALFQSLSSAPLHVTAQQLYHQTQQALLDLKNQIGLRTMPSPQLEGPIARFKIPLFPQSDKIEKNPAFPSIFTPRLFWLSVHPLTHDRVLLKQGDLVGALPQSVWGIYPPGEVAFLPGRAQAYATVVAIEGSDSIARIIPKGTTIEENGRAVLIAPVPSSHKVPILLRDIPAGQHSPLATAIVQQMREFDLVQPGSFARYVIDLKPDSVHVFSADGLEEILALPVNMGLTNHNHISMLLERSLTVQNLLALENPSSSLTLNARIVQHHKLSQHHTDLLRDPIFHIRKGDDNRSPENSLQLEILTNRDGYLTIVDVDVSDGINLLFPNPHQFPYFHPQGFVRGSSPLMIPDSLSTPNRSGFHWDIIEPSGMDTIKIFFTSDLYTAQLIRDKIRRLNKKILQARTRGVSEKNLKETALKELRTELTRRVTRGIVATPNPPTEDLEDNQKGIGGFQDETADWTTATLTVQIER